MVALDPEPSPQASNNEATRPVTSRVELIGGGTALVSTADLDQLAGYHWYSTKMGEKTYAVAPMHLPDGRVVLFAMHRFLVQPSPGLMVDHINGDGLDNRRENLRVVTHAENMRNRKRPRNNKSGYKGVMYLPDPRSHVSPWKAKITYNKKIYYLGTYATAEEAARAYDRAARDLHGEHARLNFPGGVKEHESRGASEKSLEDDEAASGGSSHPRRRGRPRKERYY
ncbi:MAG TPA: HNH endonuclease [Candidatus Thermoplasmatota archaeon]|nr:HNH endonuclease [Candidatus Thermoplasmatota archaeon]